MLAGTSRLVQKMLPTGWADVVEGAFSIPNLADVANNGDVAWFVFVFVVAY